MPQTGSNPQLERYRQGGILPPDFGGLDDQKLVELDQRLKGFTERYHRQSRNVMDYLTNILLEEAQPRSPYWTGHLRRYHMAEVQPVGTSQIGFGGVSIAESGGWMGIMGIDPNAPQHPIVGGYPGEYGAVYEAYRQPWFREAIDSNRFRQSVREASSEMLNVYQSTFFDPLPYEVVASGFYSLTDQGFEFVESPTIPF